MLKKCENEEYDEKSVEDEFRALTSKDLKTGKGEAEP
jgi:hypothetical protein